VLLGETVMTELEARISRLEAVEEIRKLKHYYYSKCIDRWVCLGDEAAISETISRFCSDILIDFTGFPLTRGKEAAAKLFREEVPRALSWCQHRVMNEIIEVNGDWAQAEWYVDCPARFRKGTRISGSGLIAGRYREEYTREGGLWKWKRIEAHLDVIHKMRNAFDKALFLERNR